MAGTTTLLIVKYLPGKRDVHVVTNSTLVFPCARINPALRVTIVGGEFRPSAEAMELKGIDGIITDLNSYGATVFITDPGTT